MHRTGLHLAVAGDGLGTTTPATPVRVPRRRVVTSAVGDAPAAFHVEVLAQVVRRLSRGRRVMTVVGWIELLGDRASATSDVAIFGVHKRAILLVMTVCCNWTVVVIVEVVVVVSGASTGILYPPPDPLHSTAVVRLTEPRDSSTPAVSTEQKALLTTP